MSFENLRKLSIYIFKIFHRRKSYWYIIQSLSGCNLTLIFVFFQWTLSGVCGGLGPPAHRPVGWDTGSAVAPAARPRMVGDIVRGMKFKGIFAV